MRECIEETYLLTEDGKVFKLFMDKEIKFFLISPEDVKIIKLQIYSYYLEGKGDNEIVYLLCDQGDIYAGHYKKNYVDLEKSFISYNYIETLDSEFFPVESRQLQHNEISSEFKIERGDKSTSIGAPAIYMTDNQNKIILQFYTDDYRTYSRSTYELQLMENFNERIISYVIGNNYNIFLITENKSVYKIEYDIQSRSNFRITHLINVSWSKVEGFYILCSLAPLKLHQSCSLNNDEKIVGIFVSKDPNGYIGNGWYPSCYCVTNSNKVFEFNSIEIKARCIFSNGEPNQKNSR